MSNKFLLRSFAGGEITPELAGRLDLTKYQTGLGLAKNFLILPHGPAARRPGFSFVNEVKDSTHAVRLIPFSFSATDTMVLEFGHLYIRFHTNAGTLLESTVAINSIVGSTVTTTAAHGYSTGDWVYIGTRFHKITVTGASTFTTADLWGAATTASGATAARVYTLTTTYDAAHLFDLHYAQSSDVLTITHPTYPAKELRRLSATSWTLTNISFAAPTGAPTGVAVTPTVAVATNLTNTSYVVTAVQADGITESLASAVVGASNNLTLAGNFNTITWNPVATATRYNVYKRRGGVYGYIGTVPANAATTPVPITSAILIGGLASIAVETSAPHGVVVGDDVTLAGTGYPAIDGVWKVKNVYSVTTFDVDRVITDYAYAASTTGTVGKAAMSLVDDNVTADTTQTPPESISYLNTMQGDYPSTVSYHEQRRWFAGTTSKPQVIWATRTGTERNLTSSIPSRDADALEIRVAAMQNNQVRHLVPLTDLIALTAGGEFRVSAGENSSAITPSSISIKAQGYSGASNVQPAVTSSSLLYVQAQGARIRELAYNWETNAYKTTDVSIMAPHRFNGFTIKQLAYSRAPDQVLWAVRSDGVLLSLTIVPDQQVYAWAAHDTDGFVESVAVVAENNEDALYAVIRRTVNARSVRYIERLKSRIFTAQEDAFYLDSGLTYDGAPVSSISGLWHLEGKTVHILSDGATHANKIVTAGSVALDYASSVVHVGLPYNSDLTTLPLAIEGAQAVGQGTVKNVNRVHVRVSQSSNVKAGPDFNHLRAYPSRAVSDPYGSPPALVDGELALSIDPSWNQNGGVCVRQDLPLPLTVLSMTFEVQLGG